MRVGAGFTLYLDAKKRRKSSWSSDRIYRDWRVGGKNLNCDDSDEDEGSSKKRAVAQVFMQNQERRDASEDWFQAKEDSGVGGREILLGPALDGEGRSCGQKTGDGKCCDQTWREG